MKRPLHISKLIGALTLLSTNVIANEKPNIIFILCDDGGYADFGFQGSKQFRTPNLDILAQSGVILDQLYVTDAGMYQQRFGIEENNVPGYMSENGLTGSDMGVPTNIPFISDHLKKQGYQCAVFGKWHLGGDDEYHPFKRGFDHFVGFRDGARSFYAYNDLTKLTQNEPMKRLEYGFENYKEPTKYLTDLLADETCNYIDKHSDKPMFIYLAFNAVHSPLEIDPEAIKQFPNLKGKRQKLAAMAWSMDQACGRIFAKLKKKGIDENTIIVFTNDNGGPNGTNTSNYPLSGMKGTFLEGGIRVPGIISYPKVIKANTRYPYPISFFDFLPTFTTLAGCPPLKEGSTDGVNILPYITGQKSDRPHQTLFWKCEVRGVVRDGDWKFMRFPDRPAELYDISKDQGEQNNLASQHPELMSKYYKMLFNWEMTLDRPRWMLQRKYEQRVLEQFYEQKEYRHPQEQKF